MATNVTVKTTKELALHQFIKLRTFNELSNLESQILTQIALCETIGRIERKKIREQLELSQYSLNNILLSLKKKNMVKHDSFARTYTCAFEIPDPIDSLTFNFEIIE